MTVNAVAPLQPEAAPGVSLQAPTEIPQETAQALQAQPAANDAVAPLPAPMPIKQEVAATTEAQPAVTEDAAVTPVATVAAPSAAFAPTFPMADGKRTEFLFHVASTIRDYTSMGKTEADAVIALLASQNALSKALDPKGEVAKIASVALTKALNEQLTHEACHIPASEQEKAVEGMFIKRQAEAQHAFNLLSNANFMQEAGALAASGKPLTPPHWFDDAKKEETIAELVSDAPAHTIGNAMGTHMLHKALAAMWKLDGPLQAPLAKALKDSMPDASPEAVIGLAKSWLHDRFHRADTIAAEVKPGSGSLYAEAMKRTEATLHPTPAAAVKEEAPAAAHEQPATAAPAAIAAAPVQHEGHAVAVATPEMAPAI